ncbi:hypothetical protein [Nostoc sp. NMS8]|nr:hypothetical protein [Nostoc sp. NMS8]MBN3962689.1 hypothetical protein [Nostoc sp. NMS8]
MLREQVGGAAQRTGLSTRDFTHLRGFKTLNFSLDVGWGATALHGFPAL